MNFVRNSLEKVIQDQDVKYFIYIEYEIPSSVPSAPHYLIDPNIYK